MRLDREKGTTGNPISNPYPPPKPPVPPSQPAVNLLVNVLIPLLLLPVLQHHSDAENEHDVCADDAERSREYLVEVAIRKGRELCNAALLLRSHEVGDACGVLDEGGRGGV